MISIDDKRYLFSLKPDDISYELLVNLFGDTVKTVNGKPTVVKSRFNTDDEFTLEPGEFTNKTKVTTNVGLFLFNKFLFETSLHKVVGYVNEDMHNKAVEKMETKLSSALLNDDIEISEMVTYLDKFQWLAMTFHHVISGSFTMKGLKPIPKVIAERDKLLKENKKQVDEGKIEVISSIEKKVVTMAEEILDNDPSTDLYNSGARGSFSNNYKQISIMKGPVYNPITDKYDTVRTNFMEGIEKEAIPAMGNSVVSGAFSKSSDGVVKGGYFAKSISAGYQSVMLDDEKTNCGSKGYIEVLLTAKNKKDFLYRYIIEGGKVIKIDESNISKYFGKRVKLRSSMYCTTPKICNVCAGDLYYKLNIRNIGLTTSRAASTLQNLAMKKFHNNTVKMCPINIQDITI